MMGVICNSVFVYLCIRVDLGKLVTDRVRYFTACILSDVPTQYRNGTALS